SAGLRNTAGNLHSVLQGISHMDNGFRTFVDRGPQSLHAVDDIFADNSDTMIQLLGNMTTVAPLLYLRTPALQALFPSTRGSVLDSVDSIIHDGG
ncbi:MCE family protein, partial [Mycobacteroides abscessus subsp. abscessus]